MAPLLTSVLVLIQIVLLKEAPVPALPLLMTGRVMVRSTPVVPLKLTGLEVRSGWGVLSGFCEGVGDGVGVGVGAGVGV